MKMTDALQKLNALPLDKLEKSQKFTSKILLLY
jgi:hypothetical protein